jgi:hypothetical protein
VFSTANKTRTEGRLSIKDGNLSLLKFSKKQQGTDRETVKKINLPLLLPAVIVLKCWLTILICLVAEAKTYEKATHVFLNPSRFIGATSSSFATPWGSPVPAVPLHTLHTLLLKL